MVNDINREDREEKIRIIKSIKSADEMIDEVKFGTVMSSAVAGYFGLATLAALIEKGSLTPGLVGFTTVTGSICIAWLAVYLKEKSQSKAIIKQIRQDSGMTKDEQKNFLNELVKEGNPEAIALFDYFYGSSKRKSL